VESFEQLLLGATVQIAASTHEHAVAGEHALVAFGVPNQLTHVAGGVEGGIKGLDADLPELERVIVV